MKELNIIEAMKMPIGTEFEVIFEDGSKGNHIVSFDNYKFYQDNFVRDTIHIVYLNAKFIPVQKPVGFMEAIISENRIKVVIDNWEFSDVYMKPSEMLTRLGNVCDKWRIRIIKYGKWYIEE